MSIFEIANSAIQTIVPNIPAVWLRSVGWEQNANFERVPKYESASVEASVQPLTTGDIRLIDGLNIQGTKRAIWLKGHGVGAIERQTERGGDLIKMSNFGTNQTWKVVEVVEAWEDFAHVIGVLQNDDS